MTVTVAKGFSAAGVHAGLKKSGKLDLALVLNEGPLKSAAAVFTSNRCQANPIIWSKQAIQDGEISAIVLNSGGANCYTGPQGFQTTHATAEAVADALSVSAGDVLVCSTGLIGDLLERAKLLAGVAAAAAELSDSAGAAAATGSREWVLRLDRVRGASPGAVLRGPMGRVVVAPLEIVRAFVLLAELGDLRVELAGDRDPARRVEPEQLPPGLRQLARHVDLGGNDALVIGEHVAHRVGGRRAHLRRPRGAVAGCCLRSGPAASLDRAVHRRAGSGRRPRGR